jgi:thiamine pyrophosphokinase
MSVKNIKKALIIGNGDLGILAQSLIDFTAFDYCLLLDSSINSYYNYNITHQPNGLLGDFDRNFNPNKWKDIYRDLEIIHTPDQEKTDFEKGIEFLIANKFTHITGIGLTGKRMDHTFNNISSLAKYNQFINIELIDKYSKIQCIDQFTTYKNNLVQNTIISLLPIGKVQGIKTKNLVYNLNNEDLELGIRTGSSNSVFSTGMVEIEIGKGKLIIMVCND